MVKFIVRIAGKSPVSEVMSKDRAESIIEECVDSAFAFGYNFARFKDGITATSLDGSFSYTALFLS